MQLWKKHIGPEELMPELKKLHTDSYRWSVICTHGDESAAQDVLQQVYLKILEGRARYQQQASLKTWLFTVIRNTAIDTQRSWTQRNVHFSDQLKDQADETSNEMTEEVVDMIKTAILKLSERQREIVNLVFYHDMTIEDAAEVMNVKLGTARTHYERGKHQLKRILNSMGIDMELAS